MIKFNTILESEGINPAKVKLVRHVADGAYQLWLTSKERFGDWQKFQANPEFNGADILATFVKGPLGETLFLGLHSVNGVADAPAGLIDPLTGQEVGQHNTVTGQLVGQHLLYDLSPMQELSEYQGRLVIDWGQGFLKWVQLARNQNKSVTEIRRFVSEPLFPGFLKFQSRLSGLSNLPASWRLALSLVSGVYLLVHPDNGKPYVGIATGVDGFWGRWSQYVVTGHGGNQLMQDIPRADYHVRILEVASMPINLVEIAELENRWKEKLLSREFGLNAN